MDVMAKPEFEWIIVRAQVDLIAGPGQGIGDGVNYSKSERRGTISTQI
jgi:hypothetical protein